MLTDCFGPGHILLFHFSHLTLAWRWLVPFFEGFERLRHVRCLLLYSHLYRYTGGIFLPKKAGCACISCAVQWTCYDLVFVSLIISWRCLGLEDSLLFICKRGSSSLACEQEGALFDLLHNDERTVGHELR